MFGLCTNRGLLRELLKGQEKIMALIDDLKTRADAALAQAQKNEDLDESILLILKNDHQTILDLKAALEAAGTDPAKIAEVIATLDQVAAKMDADAQKKADAITANTVPPEE